MSSWCTKPPELGRCAAGVSPHGAGAHVRPMRLTPNLFGPGPRTDPRCARRQRSDRRVRVASAIATRGRTGHLTARNLHLLFLLRGRRLRRGSPKGRVRGCRQGMPMLPACRGPATLRDPILHLMYLLRGCALGRGRRGAWAACLSKSHALCNFPSSGKYVGSHGCPRRPGRVHARSLHVFTILVRGRASYRDSIRRGWTHAASGGSPPPRRRSGAPTTASGLRPRL
jgi:hypothetical protein